MKKVSVTILTAALSIHMNAQSLKIDVKETKITDKNEVKELSKMNYFKRTQNYIYLVQEDKKVNYKPENIKLETKVKSLKLVAYDFNFNKSFSFEIDEFKNNDKLVTYFFHIGYDKIYLLFWEKDKSIYTLYGNVYDEKGQIVTKRNKLIVLNTQKEGKQDFYSINSITYLVNDKIQNGKFVIAVERFKDKGDIELEYKYFDHELSSLFSERDLLPLKLKEENITNTQAISRRLKSVIEGSNPSVGKYLLARNNNLIAYYQAENNIVTYLVDTKNKKILTNLIEANNVTIKNSEGIINDNDELIIVALTKDYNRNPKDCKYPFINSLFYAKVDINTLELISQKKVNFNAQMLNKLFIDPKITRFNSEDPRASKCDNGISYDFRVIKILSAPDNKLFLVLKNSNIYFTDGPPIYYIRSYLTFLINDEEIINADATEVKHSFFVPCDITLHNENKFVLFYETRDDKIYYKIYDLRNGSIIESNSIPKKIKNITNNQENKSEIYTCYFNEVKKMLVFASTDKNHPGQSCCNSLFTSNKVGYLNFGTIKLRD